MERLSADANSSEVDANSILPGTSATPRSLSSGNAVTSAQCLDIPADRQRRLVEQIGPGDPQRQRQPAAHLDQFVRGCEVAVQPVPTHHVCQQVYRVRRTEYV